MLKITPYLGIIVVIVSLGGLIYPKLGYVVPIVFITLLITSFSRGRWFCGNLCPRGSFNDFWLGKISLNKGIPKSFRSMWVRIPIVFIIFGAMIYRLILTEGVIDKIGMAFVITCLVTTGIAIIFGTIMSPRAWCAFCPMGTIQRGIGHKKYALILDEKKCIKCKLCEKACPMKLKPYKGKHLPDCIKCGRCIEVCPKRCALF